MLRFLWLGLILFCVPLMATAQTSPQDSTITWDDAPTPAPIRHIGDWQVSMGWATPEEVYGPFPEETFQVGDTTEFAPIDTFNTTTPETYELFYISERAYFWFLIGVEPDIDDLEIAAHYFDTIIAPEVEGLFGQPDLPGIDADPRLHIVHHEFLAFGAVGIFRPTDQCAVEFCANSNQRDAIYYSLDWGRVNSQEYLTTIAHEYQHVIRHANDGNERRWMNEGLSQLAEHLSGFEPEIASGGNVEIYLENTDMRLDGWADFNTSPGPYYGAGYLFTVYLFERFGTDFVRELAASPYDGLAAVHETLKQLDIDITLDQVFTDWILANYLDDPFVEDGLYYYSNLRVPVQVDTDPIQVGSSDTTSLTRNLNQYGANYFDLAGGATYEFSFDGDAETLITGIDPSSGQWVWWSYNAESSAARLTRTVDLTTVNNATLEFALWYDVEDNFDWLSVLVSTDNGASWKTLETDTMQSPSDEIPIAAYTGTTFRWQEESLDLTPYAGDEIMIRFEYVTDGTFTYTGALIDDIRIPEISWYDDVETLDTEWDIDGFLRIPPRVDQEWVVAVIQKGSAPSVDFMALDAKNSGNMTISPPPEGVVIVIGAMAPLTAEQAEYTLVINELDN